jgi:hypothetical protein
MAALAYVLAALGVRPERAAGRDERDLLEARKRSALAAIVDLEDERAVGKLAEPDFDMLAAVYEAEALEALRALDALGVAAAEPSEADGVEAEIAAARARLECPHCGAARRPGSPCPRCGR